ncbi:MAG: hypothetical protein KIS66_06525 [Fimbriimonadaceae bacterium]|nr:hypothetical protein [Fimbriimonadaceae bacterium]
MDPIQSLIRAAVSYLVGSVAAQLWLAFLRPIPVEQPAADETSPKESSPSGEPKTEKKAA